MPNARELVMAAEAAAEVAFNAIDHPADYVDPSVTNLAFAEGFAAALRYEHGFDQRTTDPYALELVLRGGAPE